MAARLRREGLPGSRLGPEPDQEFGEVLHADAPGSRGAPGTAKGWHNSASLLIIAPELGSDPGDGRRSFDRIGQYGANLMLPVLSLLGVTLYIVVDRLFEQVEAHAENLRRTPPKTTVKTGSTTALHLHAIRG